MSDDVVLEFLPELQEGGVKGHRPVVEYDAHFVVIGRTAIDFTRAPSFSAQPRTRFFNSALSVSHAHVITFALPVGEQSVHNPRHLVKVVLLRVDGERHSLTQFPKLSLTLAPVRMLHEALAIFAHPLRLLDSGLLER